MKTTTKKSLFGIPGILLTLLSGCSGNLANNTPESALAAGHWRAVIQSPGGELPFGLEISPKTDSTYSVYALNGEERLQLDDATQVGDSVRISMDVFDAEILAKPAGHTLTGRYSRYLPGYTIRMPFTAQHGLEYRFTDNSQAPAADISGKWAVTFRNGEKTYPAVGVFEQNGTQLNGTFLTSTGDYRYLAGNVSGDSVYLSSFDGNHVYLFKAAIAAAGRQLSGDFWAGTRSHETWTATRDENATLPDANTLTYLKEGYNTLSFTFPDPSGKKVSLDDPQFRNKVVIVQLLGTWCPNCMDETKFLAPWYRQNKDRGLEIIGLAYERQPELEVSGPKIERMKKRFNVEYPVLLAGTDNKEVASSSLPMLNAVLAFPTTIFIDRQGKVRRIHTGFSGPGTGKYYEEFVEEFTRFTDELLAESI
jgi:thiol-disulfide isomerase/thioredoxin